MGCSQSGATPSGRSGSRTPCSKRRRSRSRNRRVPPPDRDADASAAAAGRAPVGERAVAPRGLVLLCFAFRLPCIRGVHRLCAHRLLRLRQRPRAAVRARIACSFGQRARSAPSSSSATTPTPTTPTHNPVLAPAPARPTNMALARRLAHRIHPTRAGPYVNPCMHLCPPPPPLTCPARDRRGGGVAACSHDRLRWRWVCVCPQRAAGSLCLASGCLVPRRNRTEPNRSLTLPPQ